MLPMMVNLMPEGESKRGESQKGGSSLGRAGQISKKKEHQKGGNLSGPGQNQKMEHL